MRFHEKSVIFFFLLWSVSPMHPATLASIDKILKPEFKLLTDFNSADQEIAEKEKEIINKNLKIRLTSNEPLGVFEEVIFKSIFDLISQSPVDREWADKFGYGEKLPLYGEISQTATKEEMHDRARKVARAYFSESFPTDDQIERMYSELDPYAFTYLANLQDKDQAADLEYHLSLHNEASELIKKYPDDLNGNENLALRGQLATKVQFKHLPLLDRISSITSFRSNAANQLIFAVQSIMGHASDNSGFLTQENFDRVNERVVNILNMAVRIAAEIKPPKYSKQIEKGERISKIKATLSNRIVDEMFYLEYDGGSSESLYSNLMKSIGNALDAAIAKYQRII